MEDGVPGYRGERDYGPAMAIMRESSDHAATANGDERGDGYADGACPTAWPPAMAGGYQIYGGGGGYGITPIRS